MRRSLPVMLAVALLSAGCNSQMGQTTPACGYDVVTGAIIITAQSVPGAAYVPCVAELKPGWEYEHLVARSGRTRFWLSSDRVGTRFLEVTFEASCDIPDTAVETSSDEPGIPLFIDVAVSDFLVETIVVPEGDDADLRGYAVEVARLVGSERVGSRMVRAEVDSSSAPTTDRIAAALDDGVAVMVVGTREYEEQSVELHLPLPNGEVRVLSGLDPVEAIAEVGEPLGDPRYRAVWYYPFEGGCVTYRFDAKGPGTEWVASEVREALGFTDLGPLRAYGDQVGYVIP